MSFWRNFIKVIFKISLAASLIAVTVFSIKPIGDNILMGLLMLLLSALGVLLLHALLGVLLELCDNVARLTEIAERMNFISPSSTLNKLSAIAENTDTATASFTKWSCSKCGAVNENTSAICKDCGEYK